MKKRDVLLLVGILLIASLFYFVLQMFLSDPGNEVHIRVSGKTEYVLPLNEDREIEVQTVRGTNTVVIKDGKVSVIYADCPDQICVRHHAIEHVNESIICLPHELVIEIVGHEQEEDLIAN